MKLYEYLNQMDASDELTCWDNTLDSEFYFSKDMEETDEDNPYYSKCMNYLIEHLEIKGIDSNGGVWVDLYGLLDNPQIIKYAKEHLYVKGAYEDDADIVEMLFDEMVLNISAGYETFSKKMMQCFEMLNEQSDGLNAIELKIVIATMKGKTKDFLEKCILLMKIKRNIDNTILWQVEMKLSLIN